MRLGYLLVAVLLLLPLVMADNEFGKVTSGGSLIITDVDVIVDTLTSRNLGYNEKISKVAKPDSIVEFKVTAKNNHTTLDMADLEMVIQIDDLDLDKSVTLSSLGNGDDRILTASLTIPSDADENEYEVNLEIDGEQNNTIHKVEYLLKLDIENGGSTGSSTIGLRDLNQSITGLRQEIGSYFKPYAECVSERESLKTQVNSANTQLTNLQEYKTRFDSCSNEKDACSNEKAAIVSDLTTCQFNITSNLIPSYEKSKNYFWLTIVAVIAIGIGLYFYNEKKRKPMGEHEEKDEQEVS